MGGIKFGLFYVGSYLNLIVSSLFVTVLYLGGCNLSIPLDLGYNELNLIEKPVKKDYKYEK